MPACRVELHSLRRVLHNVLSNAIKYSYRSGAGRRRYIRVATKRHDQDGRFWALHFENYGVGIQPDELARVFKPGYRGQLAKADNTHGSGLGLADVRGCMQTMGGRVLIDSRVEYGSTYLTNVRLVFATT